MSAKKNSPVVRRKQDKKEYPLTALSNEAIRGYSRRFYYLTSFCVPPVSTVWVTPSCQSLFRNGLQDSDLYHSRKWEALFVPYLDAALWRRVRLLKLATYCGDLPFVSSPSGFTWTLVSPSLCLYNTIDFCLLQEAILYKVHIIYLDKTQK